MSGESGGRSGRRDAGRRPSSVRTRLIAFALVPFLGLSAMAGGTMKTQLETTRSAARVHRAVDRVGRLVSLRSALYVERGFAVMDAFFRSSGTTIAEGSRPAGVDGAEGFRNARTVVDRAISGLGDDAAVLGPAEMASIRERAAASTTDPVPLFAPVEARIDDAEHAILVEIRADLVATGATRVADGLTAVMIEQDIVPSFYDEADAAWRLMIGAGDPAAMSRRITAARTTEVNALHAVRELGDPVIAAAVEAHERDPLTVEDRATMEALASGAIVISAGDPANRRRSAEIGGRHSQRIANFFALVERSAASVADNAAVLEADAHRQLVLGAGAFAALGLASIVLSVALARSITRPLRRLRDHAAELSAGNVQIEALPARGPAEVQVTSRAFNELVGNLRLLEAKNRALAELDFDADVLAQPLPGALGRSLEGSAQALAGSISERDELRDRILHQASHDELTTLHNRSAALDGLGQALARARRVGRGAAVLLVDITDFRLLNDTHGHDVGDQVLRAFAERLQVTACESSLLARVGGDEFLVLIEDLTDPDPVTDLARRLAATLHQPVEVAPTTVTVEVTTGISFSWDGTDEPAQLLAAADLALDRARHRGPGAIEVYDRALQAQLAEQTAITDALADALGSDDELFLQYQPVIDFTTGRMTSVEALVRWNRPGLGIQPPDTFIPAAERSNLIVELDRWVLARAARQLANWTDHPQLRGIDIAVNISGRHLAAGSLADHVREALDATSIDARRLIVEVTETALVDDLTKAAAQLDGLRALGVRVALDDFGTGYTSISQLRQLPVDIVKIDRTFVQRLTGDTDRALLHLITEVGHIFGTTITAEGVETAEQYDQLHALHCDHAQGFLMSRPLPPDELQRWAAGHDAPSAVAPAAVATMSVSPATIT